MRSVFLYSFQAKNTKKDETAAHKRDSLFLCLYEVHIPIDGVMDFILYVSYFLLTIYRFTHQLAETVTTPLSGTIFTYTYALPSTFL